MSGWITLTYNVSKLLLPIIHSTVKVSKLFGNITWMMISSSSLNYRMDIHNSFQPVGLG